MNELQQKYPRIRPEHCYTAESKRDKKKLLDLLGNQAVSLKSKDACGKAFYIVGVPS